jgi:hypothetical protein
MTNAMTLSSLALLKARFDTEKQDVLDAFVSFAEVCISKRDIKGFSAEQLKLWLAVDFDLEIPLPPVGLLLNRMVKRSMLKRSEGKYEKIDHSFDLSAFEKKRVELSSHYRAIVASLKVFAKEKLNLDMSEEDCEESLLHYIDEYSIECVQAFANGGLVPIRGKEFGHWRFVVSRFVNYISEVSPEQFQYFVTVLTGRMLANALLASDLTGLGKQFRNTSIYIDTPLILEILGVLGEDVKTYICEVIQLFKEAGANLKVFTHTIQETEIVLKNAERYLETPTGGRGNVVIALREAGITPSDVALIRARLGQLLEGGGIEVEDTPAYVKKYQIDETGLEEEMQRANLLYRAEAAKRADINSIRSIYVLRAGTTPDRIENSRAVMVTNNSALARAAYSHGIKYKEFKYVSPVITDFSLANIIWLKLPLKHPQIPKRILLANCYSVLKPAEDLWCRYLDELERLEKLGSITPEQHQFLRYDLRVRDELMNLTLGDEAEISEKTVYQILERHDQEILTPLKESLEQSRSDHAQTLERLQQSETIVSNIDISLAGYARMVSFGMQIVLLGLVILFLLYAHYPRETQTGSIVLRILSGLVGWTFVALSVAHLVFGFRLLDPIKSISKATEQGVLRFLRRLLKVDGRELGTCKKENEDNWANIGKSNGTSSK